MNARPHFRLTMTKIRGCRNALLRKPPANQFVRLVLWLGVRIARSERSTSLVPTGVCAIPANIPASLLDLIRCHRTFRRHRTTIYGQPDFCKRGGVDVNWACANLSGVVEGTGSRPMMRAAPGKPQKNPQHRSAVCLVRLLARPLSRLCLHVSHVAKPGSDWVKRQCRRRTASGCCHSLKTLVVCSAGEDGPGDPRQFVAQCTRHHVGMPSGQQVADSRAQTIGASLDVQARTARAAASNAYRRAY